MGPLRRLSSVLLVTSLGASLAPGQDPVVTRIEAPARLWIAAEGLKVGWMAEKTVRAPGRIEVERYAIVGEEDGCWRVEAWRPELSSVARHDPRLEHPLLGLLVRKADGVVVRAMLGWPGEAGEAVRISSHGGGPLVPLPEGTPEEVTIAGQVFAALRRTQEGVTTWVGTEGLTAGLLLRRRQEGGEDLELTGPPVEGTADVGGTTVATIDLAYTNGMKLRLTRHEVIAGLFGGNLRNEGQGVVAEITRVATDATPQLIW